MTPMTKEETEAAADEAAKKIEENKHSSTFFDLGKARQTVYSILMGFVLKYFIEHTYEMWGVINSLDTSHFIAYSCILIYFFLNCFRFLFGLVDYSNMADDKFAPQDNEWKKGNRIKNTLKLYVINTGIFQLTVFSFSVFLMFPHFDPNATLSIQDKVSNLNTIMPEIIIAFSITTFVLLFIDVTSLYYYRKYVTKSEHKNNEEIKFLIWTVSDILEIIVAVVLLTLILFSKPDCATTAEIVLLILLVALVSFENISGYKYLEKPLKKLKAAYKKFTETLNEKSGEE